MIVNRVEQWFRMVDKVDTKEPTQEANDEPKNTFALNLCRRMTYKAMTIDDLAEASGVSRNRIKTLRSAGIEDASIPRKMEDLKQISTALGCSIEDLFATSPPQPATDPKAEEMLRVALSGPKKAFILDALQMAYVAALTSRSAY